MTLTTINSPIRRMKNHPMFRSLATAFRFTLVACALWVACPITIVNAQTPAPAGETAPAKKAPHKKTMMDTIKQGGIVMIPIGIMSVFTIYLVVDIYMRTSSKRLVPDEEIEKARQLFMAGDYEAIWRDASSCRRR